MFSLVTARPKRCVSTARHRRPHADACGVGGEHHLPAGVNETNGRPGDDVTAQRVSHLNVVSGHNQVRSPQHQPGQKNQCHRDHNLSGELVGGGLAHTPPGKSEQPPQHDGNHSRLTRHKPSGGELFTIHVSHRVTGWENCGGGGHV